MKEVEKQLTNNITVFQKGISVQLAQHGVSAEWIAGTSNHQQILANLLKHKINEVLMPRLQHKLSAIPAPTCIPDYVCRSWYY